MIMIASCSFIVWKMMIAASCVRSRLNGFVIGQDVLNVFAHSYNGMKQFIEIIFFISKWMCFFSQKA